MHALPTLLKDVETRQTSTDVLAVSLFDMFTMKVRAIVDENRKLKEKLERKEANLAHKALQQQSPYRVD